MVGRFLLMNCFYLEQGYMTKKVKKKAQKKLFSVYNYSLSEDVNKEATSFGNNWFKMMIY